MLACSVLEPCGPLGVGDDLSVFSGGVITGVVVVGVPLLDLLEFEFFCQL